MEATPGSPCSSLEEIIDEALGFKFNCSPEDSINSLCKCLRDFENKLKDRKGLQGLPLIQEIVMSQFAQEFPERLASIEFTINALFEEELSKLEEKKGVTSGKGITVPKEIEKSIIIDAFKRKIRQNLDYPLPDIITNPYIINLKGMLNCFFDIEPSPEIDITEKEFETFCQDFLKRVSVGSTKLFDENEMKITPTERYEMCISIMNGLAFSRTKFTKEENEELIRIITEVSNLVPITKITLNEIEKTKQKLKDSITRSERRELNRCALLMLSTSISHFNKNKLMIFTASLFTIVSGYYQPDKSFVMQTYTSVRRACVRKMISKLSVVLSEEFKKQSSLISFKSYKVFEKCIGTILNIGAPLKELEAHSEKNLLAFLKKSPEFLSKAGGLTFITKLISSKQFKLINLTPERRSPHVILCFSGFLSENDDMRNSWRNLIASDKESVIYAVRWGSYNVFSLLKFDLQELGVLAITSIASLTFSSVALALKLNNAVCKVIGRFNEAEKQAKQVGSLMAYVIAKSDLFKGQSVSLMGFSLGVRAVISCIKELSNIYQTEKTSVLVDNVVMLGGAAILKKKAMSKWGSRFDRVSGRIINVYATNDWALKVMGLVKGSLITKDYPLGTYELQLDIKDDSDEAVVEYKRRRIENYDVTELVSGHLWYRSALRPILKKANLD